MNQLQVQLELKWLHEIELLFKKNFMGGEGLLLFGSRVKGNALPFSDVDLSIVGRGKLDLTRLGDFKSALSNSNLPFLVDVIDFAKANTQVQDQILSHSVWLVVPSTFMELPRECEISLRPTLKK